MMSLYHFLRVLLVGAAVALTPWGALAQTKIRFQLDWVTEGQHAPFWVAQYKGYFKEEGLDVQMDIGSGSAVVVQRLASGVYDMGYGDITALIEFMGQNASNPAALIQAVYIVQQETPASMVFKTRANIQSPKDLPGKTLGAPVFDTGRKLWPLFARAQGLDPAAVKWQSMDPALRAQMLVRDQVDVITGFQPSTQMAAVAAGARADELKVFHYKDYGVRIYGNAILVRPRFLEEQPKAIAAFLRAFNRALRETIANPEAAIKYVKQREPLIDEALELRRLKGMLDQFIATPTARANGLGVVNAAKLDQHIKQVSEVFKIGLALRPEQLFNSTFLPKKEDLGF